MCRQEHVFDPVDGVPRGEERIEADQLEHLDVQALARVPEPAEPRPTRLNPQCLPARFGNPERLSEPPSRMPRPSNFTLGLLLVS